MKGEVALLDVALVAAVVAGSVAVGRIEVLTEVVQDDLTPTVDLDEGESGVGIAVKIGWVWVQLG